MLLDTRYIVNATKSIAVDIMHISYIQYNYMYIVYLSKVITYILVHCHPYL